NIMGGGRTRSSIQLNDSAVVRRNIDVRCRRYFGFALTLLALFSSTSCTRSDSNSENLEVELPGDTTVLPEETIDYTGLRKFISESVGNYDYCRTVTAAGEEFRLVSVSGRNVSVAKGRVPYILTGSGGDIIVDGKTLRGDAAPKISYDRAPAISATQSGNLLIDGVDIGVKAGKTLQCVINARKHIYFCFDDVTMTLGSEMFTPYNPALPENRSELNVLFIGNSFTVDATEHLPGMITASGITGVNMTRLYHGGYTLPEYYSNFYASGVCARYDYVSGAQSWSGNSTLDDTPSDALSARVWDVIVIQEHTGRSEAWSWPGVLEPAVEGLRDIFYTFRKDSRPTVVYLMSQTYSNGSTVLLNSFGNSREKMFATTSGVVKQLMADTGIDVVISTGAVLENLRTSRVNVDNGLQLTRDSYHMDFGLTRYAAACAVFETIITPATGKSIDNCPYRYSVSSTESGKYCTPVTDDNAPVAQQAAHEAVRHPFAVTAIK
ncbi:DUF4886 domain-containing protein, partial [Muribaculum intestinale]|uniref:DUF4886 domain-containing protein n=2 Tax=Muribaculum intestinale TaxID=1796646 RepID=UPI0025B6F470